MSDEPKETKPEDSPEKREAALNRLLAENQLTLDACRDHLTKTADVAERTRQACEQRLKDIAAKRAKGEKVDDAVVGTLLERQQEAISAYTVATEYLDKIKLGVTDAGNTKTESGRR